MGADVEPLSVSLADLIMKRIRIIGSQQNGPEYLYEALDFVAKGKVKTIVETIHWRRLPRLTIALRKARPGSAPSSQCSRRCEQSPPLLVGSNGQLFQRWAFAGYGESDQEQR
jgi:hypothetical protein